MTGSVSKVTPIQLIDGKSRIKNGGAVKMSYVVITHNFHVTCY